MRPTREAAAPSIETSVLCQMYHYVSVRARTFLYTNLVQSSGHTRLIRGAQPMCSFGSLLSLSEAIPVTIEHVVIAFDFLWCRVYYNDSITRSFYNGASQYRKNSPSCNLDVMLGHRSHFKPKPLRTVRRPLRLLLGEGERCLQFVPPLSVIGGATAASCGRAGQLGCEVALKPAARPSE